MTKNEMKELIMNNIPENDYQVLNCSVFYKAMKKNADLFKIALNELIKEQKIHMDTEADGVKLYKGTCNNYFDKKCVGEVLSYEVYSSENHTYPNRFWGSVNYCKTTKEDDEKNGYILIETDKEACLL